MSENNTNTSNRPRGRDSRRRGNNRGGNRGGNFRNPGPRPNKAPQQTGFQKFLSIITFGLLGKPKAAPHSSRDNISSGPAAAPKELGPIARADRAERDQKLRETHEPREAREPRESREPRAPKSAPISADVTNERLYIGNLSYDATESDLFELFKGSGSVRNAEVVVNSRTQRSKGFAFVTMTSIDGAKKAVADLNGKDFMGRPLVVGGAKPMAPREERPAFQKRAEAPAAEEIPAASAVKTPEVAEEAPQVKATAPQEVPAAPEAPQEVPATPEAPQEVPAAPEAPQEVPAAPEAQETAPVAEESPAVSEAPTAEEQKQA